MHKSMLYMSTVHKPLKMTIHDAHLMRVFDLTLYKFKFITL